MTLPLPNLDDRDFASLLSEAKARIRTRHPAWTDLGPHDPGMVLLEAFAHLTDLLLYRLNRVPDKVYVALLRLIGVELRPPRAALAEIEFSRSGSLDRAIAIPQGTRVASSRSGSGERPSVFTLAVDVEIAAGERSAHGTAFHADWVRGEVIGRGTGQAGMVLRVARAPIVAIADDLEVIIGVEMADGEDATSISSRSAGGKRFRLWREVNDFARTSGEASHIFAVDRVEGQIRFAPAIDGLHDLESDAAVRASAALGAIPARGREIRAWYWSGGGATGNVVAGSLDTLKDSIARVKATNPLAATGGLDVEELENALARGPLELFSLDRAVTAQDFETLAARAGVARSRAFASKDLWTHAAPGSVDIVLVPELPLESAATLENLVGAQTEGLRRQVIDLLDGRQPIGTKCRASWARFKPVRVEARVVVHRPESAAEVRERVLERLRAAINPLPSSAERPGWRFGEALRASHIYEAILSVPGVRYANQVELVVDEVPERDVDCLRRHPQQSNTWFSATEGRLFRSQNDGESWELIRDFGKQRIATIAVHAAPEHAGLMAVATNRGGHARIFTSNDSGETWAEPGRESVPRALLKDHEVRDLAWTDRDSEPVLFVATNLGLYRLFTSSAAGPELIVVDEDNHPIGVDAVVAVDTATEHHFVAVAAAGVGDVHVSTVGGASNSFLATKLRNVDVGTLHAQPDGLRNFLWAGARVVGNNRSTPGCYVTELSKADGASEWRPMADGWRALSCNAIATQGRHVFAASHDGGVLRLDITEAEPRWTATPVDEGLPLDPGTSKLRPVLAVAVDGSSEPGSDAAALVLAGGPRGLFASPDGISRYSPRSQRRFAEAVKIPPNWLLCSADHIVTVEVDDAPE